MNRRSRSDSEKFCRERETKKGTSNPLSYVWSVILYLVSILAVELPLVSFPGSAQILKTISPVHAIPFQGGSRPIPLILAYDLSFLANCPTASVSMWQIGQISLHCQRHPAWK